MAQAAFWGADGGPGQSEPMGPRSWAVQGPTLGKGRFRLGTCGWRWAPPALPAKGEDNMGRCPWGTQALLPPAMRCHSPLVFGSLRSLQPAQLPGEQPGCPRSHQAPRKEAPQHDPGHGSAPAASVPGAQVLGMVLSPVPGVWLALVLGHFGAGGYRGCPPAVPWGWYPAKQPLAPQHPRALTASVRCQRSAWCAPQPPNFCRVRHRLLPDPP